MADLSDDELQEIAKLRGRVNEHGHADWFDATDHRFYVVVYEKLPALLSELQRRRASDAVREEAIARLRAVLIELHDAIVHLHELEKQGNRSSPHARAMERWGEAKRAMYDEARRIAEQPHET